MAEGYVRYFAGALAIVKSAGIEAHGVNPRAVKVMKEDGIDISRQTSNRVEEYAQITFDFIITVCDHAKELCPVFPSNAVKLHQNFPDPAKVTGSEVDILQEFRRTRDSIKAYSKNFVKQYL